MASAGDEKPKVTTETAGPDQTGSATDETMPTEPDAVPASEADDSALGEEPDLSGPSKRRVQLNPSIGIDEFKAVPMRVSSTTLAPQRSAAADPSGPASDEEKAASVAGSESQASVPAGERKDAEQTIGDTTSESKSEAVSGLPSEASTPVELPPKIEDLGDELEAEIEAAMSGEEQVLDTPVAQEDESSEEPPSEENLEESARLKGKVESIDSDNVFVDLGFRSPGVLSLRQFDENQPPEIGQEIEVIVTQADTDEGLIQVSLPTGKHRPSGDWDSVFKGQVVDCIVAKTNKGGLEINVGSLRGFLPASQIDFMYVGDLDPYVGEKLTVRIIEANRQRRNLVVSRRAYLEIERQEAEEALWFTIREDQKISGMVKTLKDYGAFVDLGGVDGFLHIGDISWTRINHPSDVLKQGDQVDVKILSLDREKKRISLGMKQLIPNPWTVAAERYPSGRTVVGTVTRIADFGAFIELEAGVEGLVHISELDYKRVNKVNDVLSVGQEVDVQVLEVDPNRRRIGLSIKALKPAPQKDVLPETKPEAPTAPSGGDVAAQKRRSQLKGGIGGPSSGGLFGNPGDYS